MVHLALLVQLTLYGFSFPRDEMKRRGRPTVPLFDSYSEGQLS